MLKRLITVGSAIIITMIALMGCGNNESAEENTAPAESVETVSETNNETEKEAAETEEVETEPAEEIEKEEVVKNETWEYGTTNGNAKNFSMFEKRGNKFYFINYQNGSLCSLDITGKEDVQWDEELVPQVLYAEPGNEINVVGDRLYFVGNYYDESKCEILSMNTDGSDLKSLYKAPLKNMIVVNDWIYFLNENQYIEKINTNGEMHTVLLEEECYYLNVYQDKLIFQLDSDKESIYSMNIDGSELTKLNDEASYEIICDNKTGDIYYTSKSDSTLESTDRICKMKLDGTEQEVYYEGTFSRLNIQDGDIFASDSEDQSGYSIIYKKLNKHGSMGQAAISWAHSEEGYTTLIKNVRQICIADDFVSYFYDLSFSKEGEVLEGGSRSQIDFLSEERMRSKMKSHYSFKEDSEN